MLLMLALSCRGTQHGGVNADALGCIMQHGFSHWKMS